MASEVENLEMSSLKTTPNQPIKNEPTFSSQKKIVWGQYNKIQFWFELLLTHDLADQGHMEFQLYMNIHIWKLQELSIVLTMSFTMSYSALYKRRAVLLMKFYTKV